MRKAIILAAMIVALFLCSLPVLADDIVLKPTGENTWAMHNLKGDFVGTLKREEQGTFTYYNKDEKYMGRILKSGVLQPKNFQRAKTSITPEEAQLYLDVLKAIETIK